MSKNIELVEKALALLHNLETTIHYLGEENKSHFSHAQQAIKEAEHHLNEIIKRGIFDVDKIREALEHIKRIEELLKQIETLVIRKNHKVIDEIATLNKQGEVITKLITLLEKTINDLDSNAQELNTTIKDIQDITSHLHGLDEIEKILQRENEDLVNETQEEINEIDKIKQEVTALKHFEEELRKANEKLLTAGNPPNQEVESAIQSVIQLINRLEELVNHDRITEMQNARREYYRLLAEFKKQREQNNKLKKQFKILKDNTENYISQDPLKKGTAKNKLMGQERTKKYKSNYHAKGAVEQMISLCQQELQERNALISELNRIKDIVEPAKAQFNQEIWETVEKIKQNLAQIISLTGE